MKASLPQAFGKGGRHQTESLQTAGGTMSVLVKRQEDTNGKAKK